MGLTIHYSLQSHDTSSRDVRKVIEDLRRRASALPFDEVSELLEAEGDACSDHGPESEQRRRWLLIQATRYLEVAERMIPVEPSHIIAFTAFPGDGCEPANIGLCLYPKTVTVPDLDRTGKTRRVTTGLNGWQWGSFCKTQYASNPECGGVEQYLRCHLSVIALLDHARTLGILAEVRDEGGYWEHRDARRLTAEVGQWNEMIAGVVGRLKDKIGDQAVAEITRFPNFEHLEARGRRDEL